MGKQALRGGQERRDKMRSLLAVLAVGIIALGSDAAVALEDPTSMSTVAQLKSQHQQAAADDNTRGLKLLNADGARLRGIAASRAESEKAAARAIAARARARSAANRKMRSQILAAKQTQTDEAANINLKYVQAVKAANSKRKRDMAKALAEFSKSTKQVEKRGQKEKADVKSVLAKKLKQAPAASH